MLRAHHRPATLHESLVHQANASISSGLSKPFGHGVALPVVDRGRQIRLVRGSRGSTQTPDRGVCGCHQKASGCTNGGVVIFRHHTAHANPHSIAVSSRTPLFTPRGFLHRGLSNACPIVSARVVVPAVKGRHRTTLNGSARSDDPGQGLLRVGSGGK